MDAKINFYVIQIKVGNIKIKDVPEQYKKEVKAALKK